MGARCNNNLTRALSIADFILEGHTVKETAEEFRICSTTVRRDINLLGEIAQCEHLKISKEAREKYIAVQKMLAKLALLHNPSNIKKYNLKRAFSKAASKK